MQAHDDRMTARPAHLTRGALERYGWIVPTVIFCVGLVTIPFWLPGPFNEYQAVRLRMVDSEHGALCRKLGFQLSSDQFADCKVDMLKLWEYHKKLEAPY
jgi:hypothetical protein